MLRKIPYKIYQLITREIDGVFLYSKSRNYWALKAFVVLFMDALILSIAISMLGGLAWGIFMLYRTLPMVTLGLGITLSILLILIAIGMIGRRVSRTFEALRND